jgi:hypothetical protein
MCLALLFVGARRKSARKDNKYYQKDKDKDKNNALKNTELLMWV